jgi:hypothetical protein
MTDNNLVQVTLEDDSDREAVMARVDKSMIDLMDEKPSSRWDPDYWHSRFDNMFKELLNSSYKITAIGEIIPDGTDGITYGQVGNRIYDKNGTVQYLQVSNITISGIDEYRQYSKIAEGSHNDPIRSRLQKYDLLLINGGVGSLGRCCVLTTEGKFNISQDIDRIRFKNKLDSFFVCVFLNSRFGKAQLERFTKGVSGQTKIGFDHVKSVKLPILDESLKEQIKIKYLEVSATHNEAIHEKIKKNDQEYKAKLKIAEQNMKELIFSVEQKIIGSTGAFDE